MTTQTYGDYRDGPRYPAFEPFSWRYVIEEQDGSPATRWEAWDAWTRVVPIDGAVLELRLWNGQLVRVRPRV